ncbi:hypothetical protein [Scytonema sp. UIC 10036]|uniref:hypothetical protein n=1 Tax=Scytonema sp. UIC 10036 TaxID=2304196 RepID=UPI001A9A9461|nr:hypothetical protein [Scytonema sp. UIC 10036]
MGILGSICQSLGLYPEALNIISNGGASHEKRKIVKAKVQLGGNLARFEARALVLTANVERFPPVELAFAWTRDRNAPLILEHMNFFLEFNVCFYRAELAFEISLKKDA